MVAGEGFAPPTCRLWAYRANSCSNPLYRAMLIARPSSVLALALFAVLRDTSAIILLANSWPISIIQHYHQPCVCHRAQMVSQLRPPVLFLMNQSIWHDGSPPQATLNGAPGQACSNPKQPPALIAQEFPLLSWDINWSKAYWPVENLVTHPVVAGWAGAETGSATDWTGSKATSLLSGNGSNGFISLISPGRGTVGPISVMFFGVE